MVAVKICVDDPEASHELNVLRNLRKKEHLHHHLLSLVASYKQHDSLFLILPWAEADLNQYWKMNNPTSLGKSAELSTWLKQQCCGIAQAVSQIHLAQRCSPKSLPGSQKPSLRNATHNRTSRPFFEIQNFFSVGMAISSLRISSGFLASGLTSALEL